MSDISRIKINLAVYDLKDKISRYGFSTASIVVTGTGDQKVTNLVFYGDLGKQTELGRVDISNLDIKSLTAGSVVSGVTASQAILTGLLQLDNSSAGIVDSTTISVDKSSGKPVIKFNSTTDGTSTGKASEVLLPVGQSGTVALLSDVTASDNNKVGYGTKSVVTAPSSGELDHTVLNFYKDLATQQANSADTLFQVHLNELSTESINTGRLTTQDVQFNFGQNDSEYTTISPRTILNKNYYVFGFGDSSDNTVVKLPMDANGTIALVSDVSTVQNLVDSINSALGLTGTDATATIDTYNEVKAFLEGLATSPDLASTLTTMQTDINSRLSASDIVDNLTSTATNKALSANLGKVLDEKITSLSNAAVKKISLNGKLFSPSSGNITLPDMVTKIKLNGVDQTLTKDNTTGVGTINLDNIATIIKFNNTELTVSKNNTTGAGTVTINETDPVFSASPAAGITSEDISNWRQGAGGITGVLYTTSGTGTSLKHLLLKKTGLGLYTSFVELPTAYYIDTVSDPETLEIVLAKTPN